MLALGRAVPHFFSERVSPERAQEEIKQALAGREQRFLDLSREQIYGNPESPYLKLLLAAYRVDRPL